MKKYQFVEIGPDENNHAGVKAPEDIKIIANKLLYIPLEIKWTENNDIFQKIKAQGRYKKRWKEIYNEIEPNSLVLFQYPSYIRQFSRIKFLKKLYHVKRIKFIFLIHDLNELRGYKTKKGLLSFNDIKKLAYKIIVHNDSMKNYVQKLGVSKEKIINLQIFDYLQTQKKKSPIFDRSITIAGNLDSKKSGYIYKLNKLSSKFILYGPNYNGKKEKNIDYKGVLTPNEVPKVLNKGFGLIWDGDSIETCQGKYGNYLKYNNPHKLSLYLSSGMPVFIWDKAAEAKFVKENKVGFTITSLREISEILSKLSVKQYNEMAKNVKKISERLTLGYYTQEALNKAEEGIK